MYWLFGFDGCYPSGGMKDFQFSFSSKEEFTQNLQNLRKRKPNPFNNNLFDYFQVLNPVTMEIVNVRGTYDLEEWAKNNLT